MTAGTDAWRNWRAFARQQPELENVHEELHSDRFFVGGPIDLGPYQMTGVVRAGRPQASEAIGPAVRVRLGVHDNLMPVILVDGELAEANSDAYHGGTIGDELASLVSLTLGVRLRNAGTVQISGIHADAEPSAPIHLEVPVLARPGPAGVEHIPASLARRAGLDGLGRLDSYAALSSDSQIELARAARAYASALWWANEDPNQSWLQMVTAVEIAATHSVALMGTAPQLLEANWPELWAALESAEESVRDRVSKLLSPQVKATQKFVEFLARYAPAPPPIRPLFGALEWGDMRAHVRLIYGHRSKALHAGKPFPLPMLSEPRREEDGAVQEVPYGHNAGGLGGVWDAAESPMLLATFEHITRGALLRWWDELPRHDPA